MFEYNTSTANLGVSLDTLIPEPDNVGLGKGGVGRHVDSSVRFVVFGQVHLGLVVDSEVGQFSLDGHCDLLSNVGHLKCLLSQFPLVPVVVRLYILFDEMDWRSHALINHQGRRDGEQRMHTVSALEQCGQ